VGFVQALRREDLDKVPDAAETLDFAAAVSGLGVADLTDDPGTLQAALVTLLKTQADRARVPSEVAQPLARDGWWVRASRGWSAPICAIWSAPRISRRPRPPRGASRRRSATAVRAGSGPTGGGRGWICAASRASVATGGEPLRLFRRARPDRPANIVALCDVWGLMTVCARVFLSFLKGLIGAIPGADAYLFHTRLVRITDALRDPDPLRAINRLSLMAQGFGGGTRIGGALAAFNRGHARARVNGRSVAIVLSDGYDTDPPGMIGAELARLRKRGCRIVWLNPLLCWQG